VLVENSCESLIEIAQLAGLSEASLSARTEPPDKREDYPEKIVRRRLAESARICSSAQWL
jgi:hypothetical protein